MLDIVEKMTRIGNAAVKAAQEENRRNGIANVYVLNGRLVWQLPDGSITTNPPTDTNLPTVPPHSFASRKS